MEGDAYADSEVLTQSSSPSRTVQGAYGREHGARRRSTFKLGGRVPLGGRVSGVIRSCTLS